MSTNSNGNGKDVGMKHSSMPVEQKKPLTSEEINQMLKKSAEDKAEQDYRLLQTYPEWFHQDCQPTFEQGAWACKKETPSLIRRFM